MIIKQILTFLILMVFTITFSKSFSQSQNQKAITILSERGEVYFKFNYSTKSQVGELSKFISIDKVNQEQVFAYANKDGFKRFLEIGLEFQILTAPGLLSNPKMKEKINTKEDNDWDFYPTYEGYVEIMEQFEEDYPDLCEVFSIAETPDGRDLMFARISDNVGNEEGEPQFLYTSSIHGDETAGFVTLLRLIDYLLTNYETDSLVTKLVDNMDIWINPLANPDGTYYLSNSSVYGAIRYNSNGVDLNRNYPDPEDGDHPDGYVWQPETIAFMELAEENNFVMSANFHGGEEVCNYPWDTWSQLHADEDWWQYVCHEYADTAQFYSPTGYLDGFDDGITNGYDWYTIDGGRQDYMTYFHQCREFTMEMSYTKLYPTSQLPDMWEYHYRSLLNYLEQALYGLTGTVTDSASGEAVKAMVFIDDHDIDSSMVFSVESTGKYFRPIFAGTYDITFSAEGYNSKTIENVFIENKDTTLLNVQLVPESLTTNSILFAPDHIRIFPVPARDELSVVSSDEILRIELIDISGKMIYNKRVNSMSAKLITSDLNAGLYFLHISTENGLYVQKIQIY